MITFVFPALAARVKRITKSCSVQTNRHDFQPEKKIVDREVSN